MFHPRALGFERDTELQRGEWYHRGCEEAPKGYSLGNYSLEVTPVEVQRAEMHTEICAQLNSIPTGTRADLFHIYDRNGKWRGYRDDRPCTADGHFLPSRCRRREGGTWREVDAREFFRGTGSRSRL